MPTLHTELHFKGSKKPKISIEIPPGADTPDKLSLGLMGILTPEIAEALGCGWVYASGTIAHDSLKRLAVDGALFDVELKLSGKGGDVDTIYPEEITGFVIAKLGDGMLSITMTVNTSGNFDPLLDFFRRHREEGFEFIIRSRQGKLFEGGSRVEMSEDTDLDRSHENRPRGGKRGRKVQSIADKIMDEEPEANAEDEQQAFLTEIEEHEENLLGV